MPEKVKFEISIPSDSEGFVLLKCPSCSEEFMLSVEDIEDDSFIDIWCPGCGILHNSYMTDDVAELAERMIENYVAETLNNFDKELNKIFKNNKNIKLKPGKKVKKKQEFPIGRKIGDFVIIKYRCCDEEAKILNIRKFVGGYCPFCGGLTDGN
jgi:DNA-directed RNA polymerase subunit RPC12/RpoP